VASLIAACRGTLGKDSSAREEIRGAVPEQEVATGEDSEIDEPKEDDSDSVEPEEEDTDTETEEECLAQNLVISLSEHPELLEIGGSAIISFPDQFVHLLVVCIAAEHWIAVWKICSHGNCDVEWDEAVAAVRCPCHDSLFAIDGSVIEGPAETGLKEFMVCRQADQLFVRPA